MDVVNKIVPDDFVTDNIRLEPYCRYWLPIKKATEVTFFGLSYSLATYRILATTPARGAPHLQYGHVISGVLPYTPSGPSSNSDDVQICS